jgi:A/G-specific adenine glycosylase
MEWPAKLIAWYHDNARSLPWRDHPKPYRVWISEIMLQQTQVDTVLPYFDRFLGRFPTVETLAVADQADVLKLWEGLGYYSRARNLHRAAGIVASELNGELPTTFCGLRKLPGFGPYTAAAVASIAFGEAVPVVDGNVLRVYARLTGMHDDVNDTAVKKTVFEKLRPHIAPCDPSAFNQGMMELGALICRPRQPRCDQCPLYAECVAYRDKLTQTLPVKSPRVKRPHYDVAVGVVWKDRKILVGQRPPNGMLGGLWEFPGGKAPTTTGASKFLRAKIKSETGIDVKVTGKCCTVKHAYTHFEITLTAYSCHFESGRLAKSVHDELRWLPLSRLNTLPFPKTTLTVIQAVKDLELVELVGTSLQ